MTHFIHPIRSGLVLVALAVILAACGTGGESPASEQPSPSAPATPSEEPSVEPSEEPSVEPSEAPTASPEPVGILTIADGMVPSGPGLTLAEALAGDLSQPVLVRGVLFRDADGVVYLADEVTDASVPTFGDLRLMVENIPTDGPTWDLADAEITGLQEANGTYFYPVGNPFYGTIRQ